MPAQQGTGRFEKFRIGEQAVPATPPSPPSITVPPQGAIFEKFRITPVGTGDATLPEGQEPLSLFWRVIGELQRPQKAMFAGVQSLEQGGSLADSFAVVKDEFSTGFGTGRFERDVMGKDLLDPLDPGFEAVQRGIERSGAGRIPGVEAFFGAQKGLLGFGLDLGADPLLPVPGKVFTAPFRGAAFAGRTGLAAIRNVPGAGKIVGGVVDFLKKAFQTVSFPAGTPSSAATEATRYIDNIVGKHKQRLTKELRTNNRAMGQLAREAGLDGVDELQSVVQNAAEQIKLTDEAKGVPEALENTFERIYDDYGVTTFDNFVSSGGGRLLVDEEPIRRAILSEKFAELEPELVAQGVRITEQIEDIVFGLKENDLNRFIFARTRRKIPSGRKLDTFTSMEKDYMHMATTDEFKEWAAVAVYGDAPRWGFIHNPSHSADLHSQFQKIGIRKANEQAREGTLTIKDVDGVEVEVPRGMQVFTEDPHLLDTIRTMYTMRAVETSQVLDDLVMGYGFDMVGEELATVAADGTVALSKGGRKLLGDEGMRLLKGIKGFEAMALPPEAARIVEKTFEIVLDESLTQQAIKAYRFVQDKIWKAWTLLPFSEYHVRNVVTNQVLKHHAGMSFNDIGKYQAKAGLVLSSAQDPAITTRMISALDDAPFSVSDILSGENLELGGRTLTRLETLKLADDMGVIRSGQFGTSEFSTDFAKTAKVAKKEGFSRIPAPIRGATGLTVEGSSILRAGGRVGSFIEDTDRLSLFMWAMDEGMDARTARDLTAKYMIDYNDLTDFEKRVMKGWFPFYSWSRKAIPLMLESLVSDPTKFSAVGKIRDNIESMVQAGDAPPDRILPEYIKQGVGIRYRQDENGDYEYALLNNWIPQAQLADIDSLEELPRFIVNQLGPIPKTLAEQFFREYTFYDREFGIGNQDFVGFRLKDWQINILRNARALSVLDRFLRVENNPGKVANVTRMLSGINTIKINTDKATAIANSKLRGGINEIQSKIRQLSIQAAEALQRGDERRAIVLKSEIEGHKADLEKLIESAR